MGLLDGKTILVAGVTMDSSIGFATAKVAQEQGATVLISNFGRALGITRRIAKRLPVEPPVLELDVTDEEHLAGLADAVREHLGEGARLDGVVHSIAYNSFQVHPDSTDHSFVVESCRSDCSCFVNCVKGGG